MTKRAILLGLFGLASVGAGPPRAGSPGTVPVVVELFTSEGCSSCPPADDVLAALERASGASGVEVVPIALHVDYWNALGWPDPFSSAWATARQRSYASLGAGTYTPQAVVDGRAEVVGSRRAALEAALAAAAKAPHEAVAIDVTPSADAFDVRVRTGALPEGGAGDAEIVLAVTQRAARVAVPRGENAGKTLEHVAIARELRVVGPAPKGGAALSTRVKLPLGLAAKDARVVAFVQERASRRIVGAATSGLAP